MGNRYDRQLDLVDVDKLSFPIHIIGVGGIGSWVALVLAKMGCDNILVYDNDKVEDHNVATQFFREDQLGEEKTKALAKNIKDFTGTDIIVNDNKVEEYIDNGLVIIAVDSMEERIRLGNIYKDKDLFIIDARMGGVQLEIYRRHSSRYLESTVDPAEVSHEPCTARAICYNTFGIASHVGNFVKKFAMEDFNSVPKEGDLYSCYNNVSLLKK